MEERSSKFLLVVAIKQKESLSEILIYQLKDTLMKEEEVLEQDISVIPIHQKTKQRQDIGRVGFGNQEEQYLVC